MPNFIKCWEWVHAPRKYKKHFSVAEGTPTFIIYIPNEILDSFIDSGFRDALSTKVGHTEKLFALENGDWVTVF